MQYSCFLERKDLLHYLQKVNVEACPTVPLPARGEEAAGWLLGLLSVSAALEVPALYNYCF